MTFKLQFSYFIFNIFLNSFIYSKFQHDELSPQFVDIIT